MVLGVPILMHFRVFSNVISSVYNYCAWICLNLQYHLMNSICSQLIIILSWCIFWHFCLSIIMISVLTILHLEQPKLCSFDHSEWIGLKKHPIVLLFMMDSRTHFYSSVVRQKGVPYLSNSFLSELDVEYFWPAIFFFFFKIFTCNNSIMDLFHFSDTLRTNWNWLTLRDFYTRPSWLKGWILCGGIHKLLLCCKKS